jgi:Xaa-Pro aminopeptidase
MSGTPHVPGPGASELDALRRGRLARLQAAMADHGMDACLFFEPANVRYATGTSVMATYCLGSHVRCALVPVDGAPILFEHPGSTHISGRVVDDVRVMHAWEYADDPDADAEIWAGQIAAPLVAWGLDGTRLGIDRLAPGPLAALQRRGFTIADTERLTLDARAIKTPEELALLRLNGRLACTMLERFEAVVAPGVREVELLAELTDALLRGGGEYLITRACVSGPNTNPWNLEAGDRAVEPGDLVFVDTDAVGVEGYFADVSRTFLVGDGPATPAQRDAYAVAHDWLDETTALLRPGLSMREFADLAPRLPERYRAQRYECLAHSAGLEDEGPSIAWPEDPQPNGDRTIEVGMVLCLEVYCGEVGARDGVKLEDQIEVTEAGPVNQTPFPFSQVLLGA